MGLHRLLGFTTAVPDPAAVAGFYGELGLSGDGAAFSGSDGGATVGLDEAEFRRLVRVEFGADGPEDVARVAQRLTANGAAPQVNEAEVRVVDPGSRVELVVRVAEHAPAQSPAAPVVPNAPGSTLRADERAPAVFGSPRPPRRLGHLVIGTPTIAATRDLLIQGIGLKLSDEIDGLIAFLRCSPDHHNVALVDSPVPLLQHYSFECDDIDHVGHNATALSAPTRPVRPGDSGATSPAPTSTGTCATQRAPISSSTPTWTRSSTMRPGSTAAARPSSPSA